MYMRTLHTSTSVHYCIYVCTHFICILCKHVYTYVLYKYVHVHTLSILYTSTHVHTVCTYVRTYIQTLSVCTLFKHTRAYCIYIRTYTHVDTLSAFHTNACAYCVVPDQLAKVWLLLLQQFSHLLYIMYNVALYSVCECTYVCMYVCIV